MPRQELPSWAVNVWISLSKIFSGPFFTENNEAVIQKTSPAHLTGLAVLSQADRCTLLSAGNQWRLQQESVSSPATVNQHYNQSSR